MRKLNYICILLFAALFIGCNKYYPPAEDLLIGDSEGLEVQNLNHIVSLGSGSKIVYSMDANEDDKMDFDIIMQKVELEDGGFYIVSKLRSRHDKAFFSFRIENTVKYPFSFNDTVVNGSQVEITGYTGESCYQVPNSGTLTHNYQLLRYVWVLQPGEIVQEDQAWADLTTIYLVSPNYSYQTQAENTGTSDTSYFQHYSLDKSCYSAPFDEDFYLRIKVDGKKGNKLGWIKLNLNATQVIVKEIALQG